MLCEGVDKSRGRVAIGSFGSSDVISTGNNSTPVSEEVVTGRRRETRPSFCQSLSHLKITLSLTPFSRAICATQAPSCDAGSTIRSLNSFEYFLRGSFRQSCNSILRCPSVSDGRLSYQFLSNGYIRRSVYAYR
ncbi:TPA: hypothetical protein GF945_25685 [Escherichia coli]|nr:hypothetical protein [Escherichia coli]HAH3677311.1 hypothetical protein [Escherichia coli]